MGRDWLLVVAVVVVATVEAFTREQLVWPGVSLAVTVGLACLLPWRRVRPLLVFVDRLRDGERGRGLLDPP